ncbi:helix-turn-helix domain-containing protein [Nocardia sp. NPDC058499]|uniref:helix-turn-helix domain-containing protein n=1 Tax=Nocardia sp. NPDC058499 TaxID=3346530 RepID=UPI00365E69BF
MPPTLGDTCLAIRKQLGLSRSAAYDAHGVSQSYLFDIESNLRVPTSAILDRLIDAYGLDSQHGQHLHELREPAHHLPATGELGVQLQHHIGLIPHLDNLEIKGILGAYVDPLYNILACNNSFHTAWPGLTEADSLLSWIFGPAAAHSAPDHDREAAHTVAITRALAGRYRDSGQTKKLLRKLSHHDEFTRRWTSAIDVAYGRSPDDLLHRHAPATGESTSFTMTKTGAYRLPDVSLITLIPMPYNDPDLS